MRELAHRIRAAARPAEPDHSGLGDLGNPEAHMGLRVQQAVSGQSTSVLEQFDGAGSTGRAARTDLRGQPLHLGGWLEPTLAVGLQGLGDVQTGEHPDGVEHVDGGGVILTGESHHVGQHRRDPAVLGHSEHPRGMSGGQRLPGGSQMGDHLHSQRHGSQH